MSCSTSDGWLDDHKDSVEHYHDTHDALMEEVDERTSLPGPELESGHQTFTRRREQQFMARPRQMVVLAVTRAGHLYLPGMPSGNLAA